MVLHTLIGSLEIVAGQSGIERIVSLRNPTATTNASSSILRQCQRTLTAYFSGTHWDSPCALNPLGTPFQRSVWEGLLKIPFGQTRTYQEVASFIGRPKAVRAVANAIGRNPILILIPCHRVIRKNGDLGGFSAGIDIKRTLLKHEGIDSTDESVS